MVTRWENLSLLQQVRANLGALVGLHRMNVSADWPSHRTQAALTAERRIRDYEDERRARLASYLKAEASSVYRMRWHSARVRRLQFARTYQGGGE